MATTKQRALLAELAPQIANYRNLQAKADNVQVVSYESAEIARYWQQRAGDALADIEFLVGEEYWQVPYKATRNKAIDAFMRLVVKDGE